MRFFDADGLDITEDAQRKIERLFNREDFRRVLAAEIGDIGFPPRALEQYTAALEETVDMQGGARRAASSWSSTTATGRRRSSCRTCSPSSAPTCWASTRTRRPAG